MPDFGHRKSRSVDRLKIGALIERTAIVQARTQFSRALEAYRRGGALNRRNAPVDMPRPAHRTGLPALKKPVLGPAFR